MPQPAGSKESHAGTPTGIGHELTAVGPLAQLSELSGHIGQGLLMLGIVKHFVSWPHFNEIAHIEKGGLMRHTHGLMHIMRDNNNGDGFA